MTHPHPHTLDAHQAHSRLHELIVLDVRTPAEYATGHLPGALNVPLDHLTRALPDIREAAARGDILVVCASGTRSEAACTTLADHGIITTAALAGGTGAWTDGGHTLHHPDHHRPTTWSMERQVRFTAACRGPDRPRPRPPAPRLPSRLGGHHAAGWFSPRSPTPAVWRPSSPNSRTTAPAKATSKSPSPPSAATDPRRSDTPWGTMG